MRRLRSFWRPVAGAGPSLLPAFVLAAAVLALIGIPARPADQAKPQIRKFVTAGASFVLYLPQDWDAVEKAEAGSLMLLAKDAAGDFSAELTYSQGVPSADDQIVAAVTRLAGRCPGLRLTNAMRSPDRSRVVFDGSFADPHKGPREFRCWITSGEERLVCSRIEGPAGRLAERRELLLSVLSNVRLIKGTFADAGGAGAPPPLQPYRLRDGSASFGIPQGWRVQDLGRAQFISTDPAGRFSFMVAKADLAAPQMGINAPGLTVLPYMAPHDALARLCATLGIATNMKFLWVQKLQDLERQAAQGGANAAIEAFLYTCDGRTGPTKGFTFGMAFYSRVGTWSLSHFTVAGPAAEFDAFAPQFANMLQSYRIDQAWVGDYIRRGLDNLRRLQRQTSEIVARNATEIHEMMQAAYEERQKSQDYIDYQRTNFIRGEQDWISSVEGGTVYHSDTWGLTNTATGDFYEGQPFDFVHFKGENPKYRETMTPIDSRQLWEKAIRNK
jgi:hypothetical protein